MASLVDHQFLLSLQVPPRQRTDRDLDVLFSYLHGMEALAGLREPALRSLCGRVRYEYHEDNDIIYCEREISTCWYILLSGSVFIEGSMFLPGSSFGKRTPGCTRRQNECLILEPSQMIAIDYPDVHHVTQATSAAYRPNISYLPSNPHRMNYDATPRLLTVDQDELSMRLCRLHSADSEHPQFVNDGGGVVNRDSFVMSHEQYMMKRSSRASDTSSAYSGSDMMQSSIDDGDNAEFDGLVESNVDSDEEEGYAGSMESAKDIVRECLDKEPSERTEDDIETLLESMQHFPAFANMTLAIRRALCAVMVFAVVDKANTVVMDEGEQLDSWSVILNGHIERRYQDGAVEHLDLGDSFGITPTMEKMYHRGVMRTLVDDCQFVCITQADYYRILNQGLENTCKQHDGNGKVVFVTEHRILDGGNRKGHIVIRGTIERLLGHLVEDHSVIDPTYVEDFLLTYRTFLPNPLGLASKLLQWFNDPLLRSKVTRVVLLWVNNHFNDFETDAEMCEFLEKFEGLLERERMGGQLRLLDIACAAKARVRTITLTRATREEILHFSILGGMERGCGIYVTQVERSSKAYDAGIKRGDQVLEVNGVNFKSISHMKALDVLRNTTHLAISVQSNFVGFKEMLQVPDKSAGRKMKKEDISTLQADPKQRISSSGSMQTDPKQRMSAPDISLAITPVLAAVKEKHDKKERSGFMTFSKGTKIRKALKRMNIIPKSMNSDLNASEENLYTHARKSSSSSSSLNVRLSNHLSTSNPDLAASYDDMHKEYPDHVLKVYRLDQTFKYLPVHKETTAREVVMLALREFGITEPSSNFSLCEVSVETENLIKQKRLPDQLTMLPERSSLNGRYYLKNNMSTEALVSDELAVEINRENQISLIQMNTTELASQLTIDDFRVFRDIEQTEYVDDLFDLASKFGVRSLARFIELVNREMFWVVTEVCCEMNVIKRMKIIKHFIKIARHCKDCKNFNSLFAILSGLRHGSVLRLRATWEKLPTKYIKLFEDLQEVMDPSRNMAKYRNMINSDLAQPPMIPFFPVCKKDLTFIHLGNDTYVEEIVNFEKLRMIAKEVRHICSMHSAKYDVTTMYLGTPSYYDSSLVSGLATIKRTKNRRGSTFPSPKKMFEEAQMTRRVKAYLSNIHVNYNEEELEKLSLKCEAQARKRDTSPVTSITHVSDNKVSVNHGPKFGTDSNDSVRKLMALTNKVRPHNPKHPLPPSPFATRHPSSPRLQPRLIPVEMCSESSSVMSLRQPIRSISMGSSESASPTGSVNSAHQHYDTDSGHNSMASNYDSRSTSSVGSGNSPLAGRRQVISHAPGNSPSHHGSTQPLPRPPLPSYNVAIQNLQGQYTHPVYNKHNTPGRRPPLPDYHSATQMARQKQARLNMERASTHDGIIGYYTSNDENEYEANVDETEEEQVSAV